MAINISRTERMQRKSVAELAAIVAAKSLSSAAAAYELQRRSLNSSRRE